MASHDTEWRVASPTVAVPVLRDGNAIKAQNGEAVKHRDLFVLKSRFCFCGHPTRTQCQLKNV